MSTTERFSGSKVRILAVIALAVGCSDAGPTVYTAAPYDEDADCVGAYESIGLVEADALPSNCAPVCLEQDGTLYVSTVCAPYPARATLLSPALEPLCAAALAAEPCE